MDKKMNIFILFYHLLIIFHLVVSEDDELRKKFTSKCDEICEPANESDNIVGNKRTECIRGCQYFNIEFLTNARNKGKIVDMNQLVGRCGDLCRDAYNTDKEKKEECFNGCNDMMTLQAKAPYINGWLVYMGATDRNMVLLQPDFDLPSKENWVLLDSMLRSNDYDYDPNIENIEKYLYESSEQTTKEKVPLQRLTINYCIPTWMWMIPLMLLLSFIWMHYSNFIYGVFIRESLEHDFNINANGSDDKKRTNDEDFVVGSDFYFYPSPAVPPPKYNDIVEAILLGSDDDDNEEENENDNDFVNTYLNQNNDRKYDTTVDI